MFRKLFLALSFLSVGFILAGFTSSWTKNTSVDSTADDGSFTSMKVSSVPSWTIPWSVDKSGPMTSIPGLVIDSSGTVYEVYSFSHDICVATKTPQGVWSVQTVAYGTYPDWLNLTADDNGHYYVCYVDQIDYQLVYITNSGNYPSQAVNSIRPVYYTNISLDTSGAPHIVFYSQDSALLMHTYPVSSTSWFLEKVGTGFNATHSAMAIGKDNRIHVAFIDVSANFQVYYSVKSANTWSLETIDSFPSTYYPQISIEVSSSGIPHIAYYGYDNTLHYATKTGSTWTIQTADAVDSPGIGGCRIRLDHNGIPCIAYCGPYNVGYATLSGGNWVHQTLEQENLTQAYPGLVIDKNNNPEIVYDDYDHYIYQYITRNPSVAHIAYYDTAHKALKHATGLNDMWATEVVDPSVTNFQNTSIDLDTNGIPYILYDKGNIGTLQYASRTSGTWSSESIKTIGYSSTFISLSLAIGSNNVPQIAYSDNNLNNLNYGIKSTNTWLTQTIDNLQHSGTDPAIALDQNNLPHISYQRTTTNGATYYPSYIHNNGTSWIREDIDPSLDDNGWASSIAIDKRGNPHISYNDFSARQIKYAVKKGTSWTIEVVDPDTTHSVFHNNSLQLDDFGLPHITYYTEATTLYHAQLEEKATRKWYIDKPTSDGQGGLYNSLGLLDGYVPIVAYYYQNATSLNVAQRIPTFYNLPDIKVLTGQSIDSAFDLNDYTKFSVSPGAWGYRSANVDTVLNLNIAGNAVVTYAQTTINGFTGDSVWFTESTSHPYENTYYSQFKQSSFLLKKLPSVIAEGTTILENGDINLANYLSQSTTYSGPTTWKVTLSAVNSADTSKISTILPPSGNLHIDLSGALSDRVNLIVQASTDIGGTDWDKEIIRIYPVLNSNSGFPNSSDTIKYVFQSTAGATLPSMEWNSLAGPSGGGIGNLVAHFTAADQGTKITAQSPYWLNTTSGEWYTVRALIKAINVPISNDMAISVFGYNGAPPAATDLATQISLSASTVWKWYEVPIFSYGTSMYPQIVLKSNTSTSGDIWINKVEIIKAEPATAMEYGTPRISSSWERWDSSADTIPWGFQKTGDVTDMPSFGVVSGVLDFNFAGDSYRGLKMTSATGPLSGVRTAPLIPGKTAGASAKLTTAGSLINPVVILLAFGTNSVNNGTYYEIGGFASLYQITTNEQDIIRMAYPSSYPYGYMQLQLKNGGAAHFYLDDISLEADHDLDNYWDSNLF